jgi:esterase/lipase superfamily enzyme
MHHVVRKSVVREQAVKAVGAGLASVKGNGHFDVSQRPLDHVEVIFAAPDIDADVFKTSIAPNLPKAAQSFTLYVANDDEALSVSQGLTGYPRVGSTKNGVFISPPIKTIDASGLGKDFLGHTYVSNSPRVLADLRALIAGTASPTMRGLQSIKQGGQEYWKFPGLAK